MKSLMKMNHHTSDGNVIVNLCISKLFMNCYKLETLETYFVESKENNEK